MTREDEKVFLGCDFTDTCVQMAYYTEHMEEPELLPRGEDGPGEAIPLAVCKLTGTDRWLYGQEALEAGRRNQGTLVADLLPLCMVHEPVVIDNITYGPMELMHIFMKKSLSRLRQVCMLEQVQAVTFTFPRLNHQMVAEFREMWEQLPLRDRPLYIQDHKESFYRFIMEQKKELYTNDVILLEQTDDTVRAWNLVRGKLMREQPFLVREDRFPSFRFGHCDEETDRQLALLLERLIGKRLVSSILLSGPVFREAAWMKSSRAILTRGRKVYGVENLFVQGACYRGTGPKNPPARSGKKSFFMGEHQLHMNIGLYVWNGREQEYYQLVPAGTDWYEADGTWTFLLDDCDSVCFQIDHVSEEREERRVISLDWLPERPNLATRLEISLEFRSAGDWNVRLKDLGLGELFPGTGQTVTERMTF